MTSERAKLVAGVGLFLTFSCYLPTSYAQTPTFAGHFDLVVVLDESGSITSSTNPNINTEWAQQLDLARSFVSSFTFGPDWMAAAVGAYGTAARSFIDISQDRSAVVNTLVRSSTNLPAGGNSCHTCAVEFASAQFANYGRPDAPNVTIFFTDGPGNVRTDEFSAALAELQATSAVFAIGIGEVSPSIIDSISSDITGVQTSFFASSFTQNIPVTNGILLNLALYESSLGGPVAPIPEPETYAMLLAGLALLGFEARRRKKPQRAA